MKITDINVCIGAKNALGQTITPEFLLDVMKKNNIDHVVAYHDYAKIDPQLGNSKMLEIAKASNGKIGACLVIDPSINENNVKGEGSLYERLKNSNCECVRIFPTNNRVLFHKFYLEDLFECLDKLSMPLIIDDYFPNEPQSETFARLPEIASSYPNAKFVIVRYGINGGRQIMPLIKKCKNVYFTTEKMLDYLQIEEIYENYGVDKLLFGSEYPELPHAGAFGLIFFADIPNEAKEKILYSNWEGIKYGNN